jgi:hypothetical protein
MPETADFLNFLRRVPDMRVLQTCVQRCRCRIGIRGGVVRHLLFSFDNIDPESISLYDFVDTFSDIDVVVDSVLDWQVLEQAIVAALPFSGFHRWEIDTLDKIASPADRYALFPIDRVILWIDGRDSEGPKLYLDGVAVSPDSVVSDPTIDPELSDTSKSGLESPIARLLTLFRFARYYFQFPRFRRNLNPGSMQEVLGIVTEGVLLEVLDTDRAALDVRIELAVLHLMFNARDWAEANSFLSTIVQLLPKRWVASSQVLRSIAKESFAQRDFVGAAVYVPAPSAAVRVRMFARSKDIATVAGGIKSIVPWTTVSALGNSTADCCRYRDFQLGPAVIAWRSPSAAGRSLDVDKYEDYGTVALQQSPRVNTAESRDNNARVPIPIPGFIRHGPALTIRVDHGYVRALSGRNLVFQVGLVRTVLKEEQRP